MCYVVYGVGDFVGVVVGFFVVGEWYLVCMEGGGIVDYYG